MKLTSLLRKTLNERLEETLKPYGQPLKLEEAETIEEFLTRIFNDSEYSSIFLFWVLKLVWTGSYPTPEEHKRTKLEFAALVPAAKANYLKNLLTTRKWKLNKTAQLIDVSPERKNFGVDLTHTLNFGAVTGIQRVVTKTAFFWNSLGKPVYFFKYNFFSQTPEMLNEKNLSNIEAKAKHGSGWSTSDTNHSPFKQFLNLLFDKLIIYPVSIIFDGGKQNGKATKKAHLVKSRLLMLARGVLSDLRSYFGFQNEVRRVPILLGRKVVLTEVVYESNRIDFYLALADADPHFKLNLLAYDLIPLYYPEVCMVSENFLSYLRLLRVVSKVSAISNSVKNEVEHYLNLLGPSPLPEMKAQSLAVSINHKPKQVKNNSTLILSVGTIELRKNHAALVHACLKLHELGTKVRLALVGNIGWQAESTLAAIDYAKMRGLEVQVLNGVSDQALQELYDECAFTVFCSKAEGFGLPVLESIGAGKVCIASNIPAIREIADQYPEACVLVDPNSVTSLANAIEHQLKNPKTLNISVPVKTWEQYSEELYHFFSS